MSIELLLKDGILVLGLLHELTGGKFELDHHVLLLLRHFLVFLKELLFLLAHFHNLIFQLLLPSLGILQTQLRLLEPSSLFSEILSLLLSLLVGALEKFVLSLDVINSLLIILNLGLDVCESLSMDLDKPQILPGDLLVEVLHISKCSLVVGHEVVDVLVLPLFDLVDLNLESKLEFLFEVLLLLLVLFDELLLFDLESGVDVDKFLIQIPLLSLN